MRCVLVGEALVDLVGQHHHGGEVAQHGCDILQSSLSGHTSRGVGWVAQDEAAHWSRGRGGGGEGGAEGGGGEGVVAAGLRADYKRRG